jgi:transporter family-2 protein
MGNWGFVIAAILIGVALSLQPPINAVMARTLGSSLLAAVISIFISLVVVIAVWATLGGREGRLGRISDLPMWVVLGGVIGVVFVAGAVAVTPKLGVALFFVYVVAGQLAMSTLADRLGMFGLTVQSISPLKLVGLAMVLIGVVLVQTASEPSSAVP